MKAIPLILIALLSAPAWADVYKCPSPTPGGPPIIQQMPCSPTGGGETLVLKSLPPGPGDSNTEAIQRQIKDHELAGKQREIERHEAAIDGYRTEMEQEMGRLRNKKQYATNSLAGATWEQSVSEEMTALAHKYNALIQNERSIIEMLRQDVSEGRRP